MKVILKEDVAHLGLVGEMVEVKPGYGRNYLIPQGKAILATEGNMRQLGHQQRLVAEHVARTRRDSQALAGKIESLSVTITAQAGAEERLFGSVTNRDIEEALRDLGLDIERRDIQLTEPIKKLGIYTVPIRVGSKVEAKLKVWVVAQS